VKAYGAVAIAAGALGLVWHDGAPQTIIAVFGIAALVLTAIAGSTAASQAERTVALGFAFVALFCVGLLPLLFPPIAAASLVVLLAGWLATESVFLRAATQRTSFGRRYGVVVVPLGIAVIIALIGVGSSAAVPILAVTCLLAGVTHLIASRHAGSAVSA
jgi:hypothetical protein